MARELIVTDLHRDLRPFSQLLWQRGVGHRIHESAGKQVLSISDESLAAPVEELYRRYLAGQVTAPGETLQHSPDTGVPDWQRRLLAAPVTLGLVVLCVLGALLVYSANDDWLSLFTFQSWFDLGGARFFQPPVETLQAGQWWRLWTPMFLHFSVLHLVFNSLWLWEFGRRIEVVQGRGRLLLLVAVIALGSNCTQYYFAHNILFGGMSGVVYGLVGYSLGWSILRPDQDFGIPRVLIYAMIALMLLALSGIFTLFGFGAIANAAHVSGFLLGLSLGLLLAALSKRGKHGLPKTH